MNKQQPQPGEPGFQPTCPDHCREVLSTLDDKPVILFIHKGDGHVCGYRRTD